ncbi:MULTISPECIES: hypothetical protein [Acidiplasma]|jgi:hypothetical protein|uniref:Uncharacterized protein n=2 Tax=Acidiplasma TaxID=507753 RepID=A0A0Q0XHF8_9ARCH|nr:MULTISPECIES: hypothetical protein [Acidiplasma]KJE49695.1 hypothetical protein TZ01_00865 [Acidiplasma sp. MBA-1]KPV46444.1 hypothetical protein SE19_05490 [Acidiplasma aeolicum]KQB34047.1 hypothetical protein AOG55_01565 [Acidiplasma cupricumulans]KQB34168.1 hypothetical protein AOG54_01385 [Acidiplasma aeolicum]WMT55635.1 MAG: hypothetical protein RE470_03065 [Acidiplasma sp.]
MEIKIGEKNFLIKENQIFVASERPLYYGIISRQMSNIWNALTDANSLVLNERNMNIKYRIDVGENSIFFATPEE